MVKINQFLIHDTDKMLTLKENIEEIEFISLSMINNILAKFASNVINENYAISLFAFLMSKIQKCMLGANHQIYQNTS